MQTRETQKINVSNDKQKFINLMYNMMDKKSALNQINASLQLAHEYDSISHTSYYPKELKPLDLNVNVVDNSIKNIQNDIAFQLSKVNKVLAKLEDFIKFQYVNQFDFTRVSNDVNGNPRYIMKYDELSANRMIAYDASKKVGGKSYKHKEDSKKTLFCIPIT